MAGSQGDGARWRVFVSHTSELRNFPAGAKSYVDEAERAIAAAGHVTVHMADFPAADQPAAQLCTDRVRGCDVYVGVLGTRYGSPVRDRPEVSYTELEFDTATAAGLPRLVFLLDTDVADVGIPPAQLIDHAFGARQEAFRRRVQASGLVTQSFASPDQLGRLVERSLRELAAAGREAGPLPPGSVLRVWNIPARNPAFTGRDELLATVRDRLLAGDAGVVQALQGMGGVGKTQLAIEYAHRFAEAYDVAWWVDAEQAGLIGDQFAALGTVLGCTLPGADSDTVRAAVLADLRQRGRWLLMFDNAENPAAIAPWLPGGGGHVLVTSRARDWTEIAAPVEVDVLARAESVALLQHRVPRLGAADAGLLAAGLGDLPLAVAQAAGFMADTRTSAARYLDLLATQAGKLLDQAAPGSLYPRSLAAATRLAADRLDADDPAAAQLASVCAFLAPEPIPEDLFTSTRSELPGELAARAADPLAWRQTLASLSRQSLARIDQRGLVMHRLTQAILRDRLTPEEAATTRACSEAILAAADPGDPGNPGTWAQWAQLMPHLLAADLAATGSRDLRWMACDACAYLLSRGDARTAHDLAAHLRQHWRGRLGDDHENVLAATGYLAWALRDMGRYAEARELDEDTLARRRRVLGEDHPSTLIAASNLAADLRSLGEYQAARELDEDTLARRRRVLGDHHPDTLIAASNLAADLRSLGEYQAARELDEDTLARRRRVLGEDHPSTLIAASNLAADLRSLGEYQAARELDEDTLARRRRVLGEDHPSTLIAASNLAADLRSLGEYQAARELDEDTLARRRRVLGEDHPHTVSSRSNLTDAYRQAGRTDEAIALLNVGRQVYGSPDNLFDTRNALIDDRFLFGRDAMLARIGSAIRRDEHVLISGLRKSGKTSLLNVLLQLLTDYPVCLLDLQRFDRHAEDWPPTLFAMMVEAVDRWGRIGRTEWPFASVTPTTATELATELDRRFAYLGTNPVSQRLVVMLDEIERVFPRKGEVEATHRWVQATGALRALAQGGTRSVVIIGADVRPTINRDNDLGNGETNPFFSFFQEIPVALLDHEATDDMLRSLALAMGVKSVSKAFVDHIFALTGGHPSLARTIAAEAYRQRRDLRRLDEADLGSALTALHDTDSIGSFVRSNLWQPMTAVEREIVSNLSQGRIVQGASGRGHLDPDVTEGFASLRSQGIIGGSEVRVGLLLDWVLDHGEAGGI